VGLLASLGQLCMTRAYSHGAKLVVASLQYSGIVFAAFYSVVLFGDQLPLIGWPAWHSLWPAASPPPCCASAPPPTPPAKNIEETLP
jgi:S-adenosylmethionine uptake transporter